MASLPIRRANLQSLRAFLSAETTGGSNRGGVLPNGLTVSVDGRAVTSTKVAVEGAGVAAAVLLLARGSCSVSCSAISLRLDS